MLPQAPLGALAPTWTRAAIHDTVASVVRQSAFRRDVQRTLLDRLLQEILDLLDRLFSNVRGLPYGRQIAVIAAAVLVILVVARVAYAQRLRALDAEELADSQVDGRILTDPWRDAERLASAGQFTEAAHALYRGVVAALVGRGLVRAHASKTSGDYARELRRGGAPAEVPFRRFGARYDRIIYGTGMCGAADYTALLADARAVFAAAVRERAA
jgi:Domain of unknown function (DUF4129)